MTDLQAIAENLINGNVPAVKEGVEEALAAGTSAGDILNGVLVPGMDEVGRRFKANEFYVPEVLIAARAMHAGMHVLQPLLSESEVPSAGKVIMGTVKGDLHDIGKNLVAMMLEGAGFKIIDIGVDQDIESFFKAASENKADIVALSALLTTTMPAMEETVAYFKEKATGIKTMVGGAPVTQDFANKIGADGYGDDAPGAVELARKLIVA